MDKKPIKIWLKYTGLEPEENCLMILVDKKMTNDDLQKMVDEIKKGFEREGFDDWSDEDILDELEKRGIKFYDVEDEWDIYI